VGEDGKATSLAGKIFFGILFFLSHLT